MKATIISMFVVLGLMVAVPMFVMNDADLMSDLFGGGGSSGGKESIASLKKKAPKNVTTVSVKEEVKMYKWVDENGVMQFSQTPPPGVATQEMTMKPRLNSMEAPYMAPTQEAPAKTSSSSFSGNPYNPANMKKMLKDTKDLTSQMNTQMADRKAQMDKMMK